MVELSGAAKYYDNARSDVQLFKNNRASQTSCLPLSILLTYFNHVDYSDAPIVLLTTMLTGIIQSEHDVF